MFDFEFEKFISDGIQKVDQIINRLRPGELYSLTDILAMLEESKESQDFFHVVLHCHNAIGTTYQVECKNCGHISLVKSPNYVLNSICPFCHSKNLEITELFRLRTSVTQVFGDQKCSFCGKKIKVGFIGKENKVICWDCVKKFKQLQRVVREEENGKEKRS